VSKKSNQTTPLTQDKLNTNPGEDRPMVHPNTKEALEVQVRELGAQLAAATLREQRAMADYQNLVRRTADSTSQLRALATQELIEQLITPLEHLRLATQQLSDPGLNMVVQQLWSVLEENGLQQLTPQVGDSVDLLIMEVVDTTPDAPAEQVASTVTAGYQLRGRVVRHARVIAGKAAE
jgi:molecular chaperone GrpE